MRVCVEQKGPLTAPNPQGGKKVPTWCRDGCSYATERAAFPQIKREKKTTCSLTSQNISDKKHYVPQNTTLKFNNLVEKYLYSKHAYEKLYSHYFLKQYSIFSPSLWRATFEFPSHLLQVSLAVIQISQEHKSPDSSQRQREEEKKKANSPLSTNPTSFRNLRVDMTTSSGLFSPPPSLSLFPIRSRFSGMSTVCGGLGK